jgi:endonuclease V-like protein UPF0215 family
MSEKKPTQQISEKSTILPKVRESIANLAEKSGYGEVLNQDLYQATKKAFEAARKIAADKSKLAVLGGLGLVTAGSFNQIKAEMTRDQVDLPLVAQVLENANVKGQGYKAAKDLLQQGDSHVNIEEYYQKIASLEPTNAIIPPNTVETIAEKSIDNAENKTGESTTPQVLRERAAQKINPAQSKSILESADKIDDESKNYNNFNTALILAGIASGAAGLGSKQKKEIQSSVESTKPDGSEENIPLTKIGEVIPANTQGVFSLSDVKRLNLEHTQDLIEQRNVLRAKKDAKVTMETIYSGMKTETEKLESNTELFSKMKYFGDFTRQLIPWLKDANTKAEIENLKSVAEGMKEIFKMLNNPMEQNIQHKFKDLIMKLPVKVRNDCLGVAEGFYLPSKKK